MRRLVHLVLILCLALTGIGLGAARGTVMLAGRVVICTGQGVVVMDRPDLPGHPHLCPDMALSFLAAVPALPLAVGAVRHHVARLQPFLRMAHVAAVESPGPGARGPPSLQEPATDIL